MGWGQFQQPSVSQVCLSTVVQFPTRLWESVGPTQFKCLQLITLKVNVNGPNTESLLVHGIGILDIFWVYPKSPAYVWSISSNNALAHYVPLSLL